MSDIELVGCGPGTSLDPAAVVRVTFTERYSLQLDSGFAGKFHGVFAALRANHQYFPLSPDASVNGLNTAVEDLKLYTSMTVARLLDLLDAQCGFFCRVARLELLEGQEAAASQTPDGEAARNTIASKQEQTNAAESVAEKIADALGTTFSTLKWLLIAVVVVGLLIIAAKARHEASSLIGGA